MYEILIFKPLSMVPLIVLTPITITAKAIPENNIPTPILVPVCKSPFSVLLNFTHREPNIGAIITHNNPLNEINQGVGTFQPNILLSTAFWVNIANEVWVWFHADQNNVQNTNITAIAFILSLSTFVIGWFTTDLTLLLAVGYLPLSFNHDGANTKKIKNWTNDKTAAAINPIR